jgi:MATE family, multidrug efflux pump
MADAGLQGLTHRRVLKVALPIVISNVTVPVLGAVDTGVIGQLGLAAPIGAVGIGAVILSAMYWMFGFLRMGTSGLVAQAVGAGDAGESSALLMRALMIGGAAGFGLILLQVPFFWLAFSLAPASAEVEAMARSYLSIRIWGAPAAIALYGVTGWLFATERTRAALVLQLWMNGLNILLDLVFVLKFGWGIEGVAVATLLAEASGLVLGLWLARGAFADGGWRDRVRIFDTAKLKNMASVNSDILIRSVLLQAAFIMFLFLGAGFGDLTLAANQINLQFLEITAYGLDGFAIAAETLVGQAFGAGNRAALRRSVLLTSFWGLITVAVLALAFALGGAVLIRVMTTATDVQAEALRYLPWMVAAPLLGLPAWMLDGVFIGATRTRDMRNMMILSFGLYLILLWILLEPLGNHGLWASLLIFLVLRGVTLGFRYPALEASVGSGVLPPVRPLS